MIIWARIFVTIRLQSCPAIEVWGYYWGLPEQMGAFMTLTKTQCREAESRDKTYKLSDGGGLYLEIAPSGGKYWRMKYRFDRKEKRLSFGVYPIVELDDARDRRHQAKKLLSQGIDPAQAKQENETKRIREAQNTFKAVALEWHGKQKIKWVAHHANNVKRRLEISIFPFLGKRPIAQIEAPELLDAIRKVEARGAHYLAHRVLQICGQVFRYGIAQGVAPATSPPICAARSHRM